MTPSILQTADVAARDCIEILRQRAIAVGLLGSDDPPTQADGVTTEAATMAIEALLDREVDVPEPSEDACRRYYAAHGSQFRDNDRVHVRHILFAVTPGSDLTRLRTRAHNCLVDVRAEPGASGGDKFAGSARHLSNCPSGAQGGDLGWITRADCAPEFAAAVFEHEGLGVLAQLVRTRYGFHVVEILQRRQGAPISFEHARHLVAQRLRRHAYVGALRRYLSELGAVN